MFTRISFARILAEVSESLESVLLKPNVVCEFAWKSIQTVLLADPRRSLSNSVLKHLGRKLQKQGADRMEEDNP